jgi:lysine 2,3-aminomutase
MTCPVGRQALPSGDEFDLSGQSDPLNEGGSLRTPVFVSRYHGRGVFLVSAECAMYCRFCNRRRLVGKGWDPARYVEETLEYLENDTSIREVILSGGDPFMRPAEELAHILARLKGMGKRIIRISTRMPVVSPQRLSKSYYKALHDAGPVWVVIHINHPKEITPEFVEAIGRFRKSGAVLVSQTVLLRGVNDCAGILGKLFEELVAMAVKPYYLFQLDEVRGASHFKVKVEKGIEIMRALRRSVSGLAIPHYAIDISGGLGKVPVDHQYLGERRGDRLSVESPSGVAGIYEDTGKESCCSHCGICGPERV